MHVIAKKITDETLMRWSCDFTRGKEEPTSKIALDAIYECEHSPMRTQMFLIEVYGITTEASVHLRTHHVWAEHFVQSRRGQKRDLDTLVNHMIFCNAQALVNMSRKRLCSTAAKETRRAMREIKKAVATVDPALAERMVVECVYRGGVCHELKSCGHIGGIDDFLGST